MNRLVRWMLPSLVAVIAGCSPAIGDTVQAESPDNKSGFAVVELFTSQGCSSCPAADENLARIAAAAAKTGLDVYTLSFHVDYWNYLGWKDPFSSAEATTRQRQYARNFRSNRVYTPQMVVNGKTEFVGSNRRKPVQAIKSALVKGDTSTALQIAARGEEGKVRVDWEATNTQTGDFLLIALVQNEAERAVTAGENNRRTLRHVNVVRDFRTIAALSRQGSLTLTAPLGFTTGEYHVVAFVQSQVDAGIKTATRAEITGEG